MFIDKQNTLCTDQAVTAAADTTDYIDLSVARAIGVGTKLQLCVTCTQTCTAAGSATVQFQLQSDDNTSFSSPTVVLETDAIPKATLVAGYQFFMPIPQTFNEQYLNMHFNVATGPLTAGKFTVQLVDGTQANTAYPKGVNS
jgi:hypothetical protein